MKKAIILFNLGGPDKLESVKPFLFYLFNDPAILNLPNFLRFPLAKLIANRRAPTAKKIYEELGGSSPILKLTKEQSVALEENLNIKDNLSEYKRKQFCPIIKLKNKSFGLGHRVPISKNTSFYYKE